MPNQKVQTIKLQTIVGLFRKMEHLYDQGGFHADDLDELKLLIKSLIDENDPFLNKLAKYSDHLHIDMNLKHFIGVMVPFERLLGRNLADSDFLVIDKDHPNKKRSQIIPVVFVLDNLRSAFNIGSIFRTADCLGIESLFLCGYTATPENEKLQKTTMGTENIVPWKYFRNSIEAIQELKNSNYKIIAIETVDMAKPFTEHLPLEKVAFVFGNERFGLDADVLHLCDEIRSIPVDGVKNSLNVGVCAALVGYEWKRQWNLIK